MRSESQHCRIGAQYPAPLRIGDLSVCDNDRICDPENFFEQLEICKKCKKII
jgi:hypothetical protein